MDMGAGRTGRWVAVAVAGLLAAGLPALATTAGGAAPHRAAVATTADLVELRPLTTSTDRRIVDDLGRDVLLRGANVNSLGEYWQGVPTLPTTFDLTAADWDAMAARGFSVVRLLITWSRVEPQRDVIDQAYLDRVESYVDEAAAHGIYTVIDMHQDAYSADISTTDPAECPPGTQPARGWDGAPAWATLTEGLSTCLTGDRNSSPAVNRAWNNFYDDVDGIRTEFSEAWAAVATRFAGRPEVAGYDLLNEPEASRPSAELTPIYEDLLKETALAIRAAEDGAAFDHLLIVEPAIPAGEPANGLVIPDPSRAGLGTEGIVASVHNYAESITNPALDFSIEALNDLIASLTTSLGLAAWGGEYGFFDEQPATIDKARRYAADEDANAWGGAWWQWRQSCGDPHSVAWQDGQVVSPPGVQIHLNPVRCPSNEQLAPQEDFLTISSRAFPRATPGRISSLESDPDSGRFSLVAIATVADVGQQLVVWAPIGSGAATPEGAGQDVDAILDVTVAGLDDVVATEVPGGQIITATVAAAGDYQLSISRSETPPTSTSTSGPGPSVSSTSSPGPSVSSTSIPGPSATTTPGPVPPDPADPGPVPAGPSSPGPATSVPGAVPARPVDATATFTG